VVVGVALGGAVVTQRAHDRRHLGVVGHERAAVAQGAEVLRRVEAEAGGVAERPGARAVEARPVSLGGVLEQRYVPGRRADLGHRRRPAVEVDRHDSGRVRGERGLDPLRVHAAGGRVDVHEHRPGAGRGDRLDRGDEGAGHRDHLAARARAEGEQRQAQGLGAVAQADAVLGAAPVREGRLELVELGTEREGAGLRDAVEGC
jgi:hypothetical protein